MPFQPRPRLSSVLVSVLAAGLLLTVASCSDGTPAPVAHAATPAPPLFPGDPASATTRSVRR
jgi:hypothetical protein